MILPALLEMIISADLFMVDLLFSFWSYSSGHIHWFPLNFNMYCRISSEKKNERDLVYWKLMVDKDLQMIKQQIYINLFIFNLFWKIEKKMKGYK